MIAKPVDPTIPEEFKALHVDNGKACGYFVGGEWKKSPKGTTIATRSPIDDALVGYVQSCDTGAVKEAVEAAAQSWQKWSARGANERAAILHKAAALIRTHQDALIRLLTAELGKNHEEALIETTRTADLIDYFAEEGLRHYGDIVSGDAFPGFSRDKLSLSYREPYGVVAAISPFNYPLNLSATKIAPALITGNAVVLKPALQGSICALYMVELFRQAGVPAGVLNAITGNSSLIGEALVSHPKVNLIAYTGSTKVGHQIHEQAGVIPVLLELGGKDAALVLEDADIFHAVDEILIGAFSYSGQRCTAIKRVIALPPVADRLVNLLTDRVKGLKTGDPREDGVVVGPLISNEAADFTQGMIDDAVAKKARVCCGNKREGRLIHPTLLDSVTLDMRVAWEEQFGPVLPVIRVGSLNEAIEVANKSAYGLQSSVFTRDLDKAFYVGRKLEAGTVNVNAADSRGPDHFPFAGMKNSGFETQGLHFSIQNMTRTKSITLNLHSPAG